MIVPSSGQNTTPDRAVKLGRSKPVAFAIAGILGIGMTAALVAQPSLEVAAKPDGGARGGVMTPYGPAPMSFADLVEKVRPAVVSINVKNGTSGGDRKRFRGLPDLPDDSPFNEFFKRFREGPRGAPGRRRPSLAQGSGFIISQDGYVVTNNHVIEKAKSISVTLDDGTKLDAKLIGGDPRTDIALLKIIKNGDYPTVEFSDKPARVGDWVLAVGNPFGLGGTVTAGIVSARGRDIGSGPYDYLQIDAAVNRGNSGGPTFNLNGKVVGVNTAIFSPSGGNVGIAFAIPGRLTQEVVADLRNSGSVRRGWLGVSIQNVTEDIAESLALDKAEGAMISEITPGGPASKSDLKVNDAIVEVNGERIKDSRDLARTIAGLQPKSNARVTVYRDGEKLTTTVKLGRFPGIKKLAKLQTGKPIGEELEDLGLSLAPASSRSGAGDDGVVITDVDPDSKAAEIGLKTGDVILEVGGKAVSEPDDVLTGVRAAKRKGRKAILLRIQTGDRKHLVGLPLKTT
ncbi:periplasmic serine endoprotease DegP [bacterium MnTg02]|nr:periplasmic serine endoprotease DegP [bacterium MnTg02]